MGSIPLLVTLVVGLQNPRPLILTAKLKDPLEEGENVACGNEEDRLPGGPELRFLSIRAKLRKTK